MPPRGSLWKALCFPAVDKTECIMVSMVPQYVAQDRCCGHYSYCRKMCYFLLSCLVDQCHLGNHTACFTGASPVLYAGTSWRHVCLRGSLESSCQAKIHLFIFIGKKWLSNCLFVSISNSEKVPFLSDFWTWHPLRVCALPLCIFTHIFSCPKTCAINFCHLKSLSYTTLLQLLKHV